METYDDRAMREKWAEIWSTDRALAKARKTVVRIYPRSVNWQVIIVIEVPVQMEALEGGEVNMSRVGGAR